jgi:lysophospholipase L1-like esterase
MRKLTRAALERFQRRYDLSARGALDEETRVALAQKAIETLKQMSIFPVIGRRDDRTAEELRDFQLSRGLPMTGALDAATRAAFVAALGVSPATAGAGQATSIQAISAKGKSFFLLGDSHSESDGTPGGRLASLLGDLGASVRVKAVRGRSMSSWWSKGADVIDAELARRPDYTIVFLGTNDAAILSTGGSEKAVRGAYEKMRDAIAKAGSFAIVLGPPRLPEARDETYQGKTYHLKEEQEAERIRRLQREVFGGDHFLDLGPLTEDLRTASQGRAGDGVHFQSAGAKILVKRIAAALGLGGAASGASTSTPPAPSSGGAADVIGPRPTPPADPGAYRQFRLTHYYVAEQADSPTKSVVIPIYGNDGEKIAEGSPEFFAKLSLEGTGKLLDGRLINVTGDWRKASQDEYAPVWEYHQRHYPAKPKKKPAPPSYSGIRVKDGVVTQAMTFYVIPKSKLGVGYGVHRKIPLTPYRTLAADIGAYDSSEPKFRKKGGLVPPGTRVFIKDFVGKKLPDGTVHDGWFIVNDTGGAIYGVHFDVFAGLRRFAAKVALPSPASVWFEGIEDRIPPGYTYGLHKK